MKNTSFIAPSLCAISLLLNACTAPNSRQPIITADSVLRTQYAATGNSAGLSGDEAVRLLRTYGEATFSKGMPSPSAGSSLGTTMTGGWQGTPF